MARLDERYFLEENLAQWKKTQARESAPRKAPERDFTDKTTVLLRARDREMKLLAGTTKAHMDTVSPVRRRSMSTALPGRRVRNKHAQNNNEDQHYTLNSSRIPTEGLRGRKSRIEHERTWNMQNQDYAFNNGNFNSTTRGSAESNRMLFKDLSKTHKEPPTRYGLTIDSLAKSNSEGNLGFSNTGVDPIDRFCTSNQYFTARPHTASHSGFMSPIRSQQRFEQLGQRIKKAEDRISDTYVREEAVRVYSAQSRVCVKARQRLRYMEAVSKVETKHDSGTGKSLRNCHFARREHGSVGVSDSMKNRYGFNE